MDSTLARPRPVINVTTGAMIAAPVLTLASTIAYVTAAELGVGVVGGTIQVYAFAAFGLAIAGLAWVSVRSGSHRTVAWLMVVGVLGVVGGADYGINAIYTGLGASDINGDGSAVGTIALQVPGLLFPLSLIGFGILLARLKAVPWAYGALLAVAAASFPLGRIPKLGAVAIATDVLLLIAFVAIALTIRRTMRRDEPSVASV